MYRLLLTTTIFLVGFGTVLFHYIEKWSYVEAYYFCIVTLSTVGYGDLVPKTDTGRILTTFYIIIGVGILATFINTAFKRRGKIFMEKREAKHRKSDS